MIASLRRTVRLSLGQPGAGGGDNGYAGIPAPTAWAPFLEIEVECRGEPDPTTGYLIDIKTVDRAVREVAPGALCGGGPEHAAPELLARLRLALPVEVARVELRPSPFLGVRMDSSKPNVAVIRLSLEFAASHRLHVAGWSQERNLEQFGKCANPNGHGHNYRLDVAVETGVPSPGVDVHALERVVDDEVISRFDHKHLNLDTGEFADGEGLIPSVENIARVCYDLLREPIEACGVGCRLRSVRVWETDRTSCEYPAPT